MKNFQKSQLKTFYSTIPSNEFDQISNQTIFLQIHNIFFLLKINLGNKIYEQFSILQKTPQSDIVKPHSIFSDKNMVKSKLKLLDPENIMETKNNSKLTGLIFKSILLKNSEGFSQVSTPKKSQKSKFSVNSKNKTSLNNSNAKISTAKKSHTLKSKTQTNQVCLNRPNITCDSSNSSDSLETHSIVGAECLNQTIELSECLGLDFSPQKQSNSRKNTEPEKIRESLVSSIKKESVDSNFYISNKDFVNQICEFQNEELTLKLRDSEAESSTQNETNAKGENYRIDSMESKIKEFCYQSSIFKQDEKNKERNFKKQEK